MRFFRVPAFSGIEVHRDDADRGSLRVVEGCLPHGPGGMRSSPVWTKLGELAEYAKTGEGNKLSGANDSKGNSILFASRDDEVHDIGLITTEGTNFVSIGSGYPLVSLGASIGNAGSFSNVGNGAYSYGDGANTVFIGQGSDELTPNLSIYSMEFSYFPGCTSFIVGPRKCLFAAGNPNQPLRVYISEPAGKTTPFRDSPYSTEKPASSSTFEPQVGLLSTVDIIGSNATKITGLSTRSNQVVVHTDKGCHLLYAPKEDQAATGFRVEQAPATNFSAAVNNQVVAGEGGPMAFWLGHDSQIYKDSSAKRGAEDTETFADADQVSYKAKGGWESEHPINLGKAFATFDPQSGMYWVFIENPNYTEEVIEPVTIAEDGIEFTAVAVDPGVEIPTVPILASGYLKELYGVDFIVYGGGATGRDFNGKDDVLFVGPYPNGLRALNITGVPAGTSKYVSRSLRIDWYSCFVLGEGVGEVTVTWNKIIDPTTFPFAAEFTWGDDVTTINSTMEDGTFSFQKDDPEETILYINSPKVPEGTTPLTTNGHYAWMVYCSQPV